MLTSPSFPWQLAVCKEIISFKNFLQFAWFRNSVSSAWEETKESIFYYFFKQPTC